MSYSQLAVTHLFKMPKLRTTALYLRDPGKWAF